MIAFIFTCFFYLHRGVSFAEISYDLIDQKCKNCHNLKRVHANKMSASRWSDTVKRMQSKKQDWLDDQEIDEILAVLSVNNLINRKYLFERKCVDCHNGINKQNLLFLSKTKAGWQRSIERMRKRYSMRIGVDEAKEIAIYWTDFKNNKNLKLEENEYDRLQGVFENKCGACHSYNFLYGQQHNISSWMTILNRKKQKNPNIIKGNDLQDIQDYILQTKSLLVK